MVGSAPSPGLPEGTGGTAAGRDKGSSSDSSWVANPFTEKRLKTSELLREPQPNVPRLVQQSRKDIADTQDLVFSHTGPERMGVFEEAGQPSTWEQGLPLAEHKAEQSLLGEGGLAFREILELLWFADLRVSGPELMEGLAQRSRLRKTAVFGEVWHCQQKKATQSK